MAEATDPDDEGMEHNEVEWEEEEDDYVPEVAATERQRPNCYRWSIKSLLTANQRRTMLSSISFKLAANSSWNTKAWLFWN